MHMQPEDEVGPRRILHLVDDLEIMRIVRNQLPLPLRKRMGARGPHDQVQFTGDLGHGGAQQPHLLARFLDGTAYRRTHLHNRLVHFGLHAIFPDLLGELHDFLVVRLQFTGNGVHHHVFFLDANGKAIHDLRFSE